MIAHLNGTLLAKTTRSIIIDNSGIGYEVIVPLSTFYALPGENEKVGLHIYTHVREDAFILFGFHTPLEKEIFLLLISVSGIGPKLATNILSGIGPQELLEAIARGDGPRLQSIPGIGKKTAERIALELKERAQRVAGDLKTLPTPAMEAPDRKILNDAISALVNLGYPVRLAKGAVERAWQKTSDFNLEGLIKEALRTIA